MERLMEIVDKLLFGVEVNESDYSRLEEDIMVLFQLEDDVEYQYRQISKSPDVHVRVVGEHIVYIDLVEEGEEYRLSFNKDSKEIYLTVTEEEEVVNEIGLNLEYC